MKFFSKFLPLFLVLALILVLAAACSTEATSTDSSDASAQVDGGTGDGSIAGSDAGDTDSVSNDVSSTDKVDSDTVGQTDVGGGDSDVATSDEADTAKPFCPEPGDPAEAILEISIPIDGLQCFVPESKKALMVSTIANIKPGIGNHPLATLMPADPAKPDGTGGCSLQTMSDTSICFPIFKVRGKSYKPDWYSATGPFKNADVYVTMQWPDSLSPNEIVAMALTNDCLDSGPCHVEQPANSKGKYYSGEYFVESGQFALSLMVNGAPKFTNLYVIPK